MHAWMHACRLFVVHAALNTAGLFSTELFKSSRVYSIDKWHFNFLHGQYNLVEQVVQLYFGFLPWLWYSLPSILPAQLAANEITRSVCFVLLMSAISLLMNLPWSYYNTCKLTWLRNSLSQQQQQQQHVHLPLHTLPACLTRCQLAIEAVRQDTTQCVPQAENLGSCSSRCSLRHSAGQH
jgi:hypothetical protein